MKKTLLLIIFGFISSFSFSQEIENTYIYKVEKSKSPFGNDTTVSYTDLDSLVIYKNGTFHQTKYFSYLCEYAFTEFVGKWKIENEILILNITAKKSGKDETKWTPLTESVVYKIKRNNIKL